MNPLYRLWLRFGRLKPLVVEPDIIMIPTPVPPAGEAREPVNDQDGVRMRATVARPKNRQTSAVITRLAITDSQLLRTNAGML